MQAQKGGKVLYTAQTRTVGLLEAQCKSPDGRLDIHLTAPGGKGPGTNPEQLLAAGWSACLTLSMYHVAARMGVVLAQDTNVDAVVALCNTAGNYDGMFYIQARLKIEMPGLDPDIARKILDEAHRTCPFSEAMKGNVDVEIELK